MKNFSFGKIIYYEICAEGDRYTTMKIENSHFTILKAILKMWKKDDIFFD